MGNKRTAFVIIGLGFGDEGKGKVVDFLSHYYPGTNIVKYGGPQAAHHVVLPDGTHHCFSQYGSGTFHGALTYLSQYMIVDPLALEKEYEVLKTKYDCKPVFIHPECRVVTPYHKIIGRARAIAEGKSTVGMGIGPASVYGGLESYILFKDLADEKALKVELTRLYRETEKVVSLLAAGQEDRQQVFKLMSLMHDGFRAAAIYDLVDLYNQFFIEGEGKLWRRWPQEENNSEYLIFESSQGALLDYKHGFYPHVSPVDSRAYEGLAKDCNIDRIIKIGVIRPYLTRHGSGPFVTESDYLNCLPEGHNVSDRKSWQGLFRRGWLDMVMLKYALDVCGGVDYLFLTNYDTIMKLDEYKICENYLYRYPRVPTGYEERKITRIKYEERSLNDRYALTHTLENSRTGDMKEFTMHYDFATDLSSYLEKMLNTKVVGISVGPTYDNTACTLKEDLKNA